MTEEHTASATAAGGETTVASGGNSSLSVAVAAGCDPTSIYNSERNRQTADADRYGGSCISGGGGDDDDRRRSQLWSSHFTLPPISTGNIVDDIDVAGALSTTYRISDDPVPVRSDRRHVDNSCTSSAATVSSDTAAAGSDVINGGQQFPVDDEATATSSAGGSGETPARIFGSNNIGIEPSLLSGGMGPTVTDQYHRYAAQMIDNRTQSGTSFYSFTYRV